MKHYTILLGLAFSLLSLGCHNDTEPVGGSQEAVRSLKEDSLRVDGIFRYFEYQVPDSLDANPALVFVLHGSKGTIENTRAYTNYEFEQVAAVKGKFIIVYPAGYDDHWNDCRVNASYQANQKDIDDIDFFRRMITYFEEKYQINSAAIFATGISNGGHMCYKLGFELADKINGIAPFVANIPAAYNNDCSLLNQAVSIMILNGTDDPINPNDGGWVVVGRDSSRGAVLATQSSINYWKDLAGCDSIAQVIKYEDRIKSDSSSVVHYKYHCPSGNKKVELVKIENGGHTIPVMDNSDLPLDLRRIIGNKNRDISGAALVLDFFASLIPEPSTETGPHSPE